MPPQDGPDSTSDDTRHWLEVLRHNVGFSEPETWVGTARQMQFRRVAAQPVRCCPDCGSDAFSRFGQFIHYSTLLSLFRCDRCDLIYANARIDPVVIQSHFETAYKDESYFAVGRRAIFVRIAKLVHGLTPPGGTVMDVGGASGQLLGMILACRPDLRCSLADTSEQACRSASAALGVRALCRSIPQLVDHGERYDMVLMIDVAYYEPDVQGLWAAVDHILSDRGVLILRVPNKLFLMQLAQSLQFGKRKDRARRVRFFNSEHVSIFSRRYLERRLGSLGIHDVRFQPSPLLISRGLSGRLAGPCYSVSKLVHALSLSALTITPSQVVIAQRNAPSP